MELSISDMEHLLYMQKLELEELKFKNEDLEHKLRDLQEMYDEVLSGSEDDHSDNIRRIK